MKIIEILVLLGFIVKYGEGIVSKYLNQYKEFTSKTEFEFEITESQIKSFNSYFTNNQGYLEKLKIQIKVEIQEAYDLTQLHPSLSVQNFSSKNEDVEYSSRMIYKDMNGSQMRDNKQHIEIPFKEGKYYVKLIDRLRNFSNLKSIIMIDVIDEDVCHHDCNQYCTKKQKYNYYFGENCDLTYQLLDVNYKYTFNKVDNDWINFGVKLRKGYTYSFNLQGIPEGSYFHYGLKNPNQFQALSDPNFSINSQRIQGFLTKLFIYTIDLNWTNRYIHECDQKYEIAKFSKPKSMNIDGESLEQQFRECIDNRVGIVSFFMPVGAEQQYPKTIKMEILESRQQSNTLVFVCIVFGIFIMVLFVIGVLYVVAQYHKERRLLNQYTSQNGVQQNSSQPTIQKVYVPVIVTQTTLDKYMPIRIYKDLVEQMPSMDEQKDCLICLNNFEMDDECRLAICLHLFHKDCVDHWIKNQGSCPYCRQIINRKILEDTEGRKNQIQKNPFLKKLVQDQISISKNINNSSDGMPSPLMKMKEFEFMFEDIEDPSKEESILKQAGKKQEDKQQYQELEQELSSPVLPDEVIPNQEIQESLQNN